MKNIFAVLKQKKQKKYEKILSEIIITDKYKKSGFVIQKVNGKYGILVKSKNEYIDLVSDFYHTWNYGCKYTYDCFDCLKVVIKKYKKITTIFPSYIPPLNIEKSFE